MPNPRLAHLRTEFERVRSGIDTLEQTAASAGRDLTDDEQTQADTLHTRAAELGAELEPIVARERSLEATAGVLASLNVGDAGRRSSGSAVTAPASTTTPLAADAPGRYLAEYLRAVSGDVPGGRAAAVEGFVDHWRAELGAAADGLYRVVADQLTSDNAAILPVPLVGQMLNFNDAARPAFSSFTQRPMPQAGKSFTRPRITQHVLVDEQATEKTQLASRKMTLASETVTKRTFGGVLDISQQDIDWTDPGILGLVLADFADMYAQITEGEACDALEAVATNTSLFDFTAPTTSAVLSGLVAAAVAVYGTAKVFPDTIWLGLDVWANLASLVDADDKALFPQLGAGQIDLSSAGFSGSPLGLRPVLAPQLAAGKAIIGVRSLIEAYEQRKGLIQAPNVALFGVDVAYAGYVAFYGRAEGFVSLTQSP